MNEESLYIHSFLMYKEIPFLRYCHAPCFTCAEWLNAIKKLNIKAAPVISTIEEIPELNENYNSSRLMLLSLADKNTAGNKQLISPLSLVLENERKTVLSLSKDLCDAERLCFPCSDPKESVVMFYKDFIGHFIPEAHISILPH